MAEKWLPTEGGNVRVINPARSTYGKDGIVIHSVGQGEFISVLVNFMCDPGHLFNPDELDLLR